MESEPVIFYAYKQTRYCFQVVHVLANSVRVELYKIEWLRNNTMLQVRRLTLNRGCQY